MAINGRKPAYRQNTDQCAGSPKECALSKDKPTPTLTTLNEGWSHSTKSFEFFYSHVFLTIYIDRKTEKPANNHVAVLVTVKRNGV